MRELGTPSVIALLQRFAIDPIVAIFPDTIDDARDALARLAGAGIPIAAWPMLADADGRWLGAENADRFSAFVDRVAREIAPREIVLDLEPPIGALQRTLASAAVHVRVLPPGVDRAAYLAARRAIVDLVGRLRARGIAASCAIAPPIVFDEAGAWEARLGTPVRGVPWDHVSPMLYTSIIEGWSRGALRRDDARALLHAACDAAARRFGAACGASLGAVGVGAFGDEPVYRSPAELSDDVAIARAAGVDDLALFDLGGVLGRAPAAPWLEAFTGAGAAPRPVHPTLRSRAALAAIRAAGATFGALASVSDVAARLAGRGGPA